METGDTEIEKKMYELAIELIKRRFPSAGAGRRSSARRKIIISQASPRKLPMRARSYVLKSGQCAKRISGTRG